MPTFSDKLLQEVLRLILSAYFEPQFSDHSQGFRPDRGCHTALSEMYHQWVGTTYFVEGDIQASFDSLDHAVMMNTLREKIHDGRFLRLIETLLAAGYLEEWRSHTTLSGCPQGSILSPVLANVYLHKLDTFVETVLTPQYNKGERRKQNGAYVRVQHEALRRKKAGQWKEAQALRKRQQQLPYYDTTDPDYRRLRYLRYADDILLGFAGPHTEAEEITRQLGAFLQDSLKLTLSQEKTLITHARTQAARFLGYNIVVFHNDQKRDQHGKRSINGHIGLQAPVDVVKAKCVPYQKNGKPVHRKERTNDTVYSIISQYQQEFRGFAEYYQRAVNRYQLNRLKWVMEVSLVSTLAHKLRVSVSKVYKR
jgi:group II intron reverse transcriptase/maturase